MGVHGLWQLIEPSGKPVPLETLERKVLAVDVSIWLHQAVKGFQDSKGAPVPNAHLLGIYHRVCKLLYFKVKPVFIFDGGVPALKKQTIAKRNQLKSRNISEAERLQKQLLSTLLKHSAVSKILSEKTKASLILPPKRASKHENMYALPPTELDSTMSSSEEDDSEDTDSSPTKHWDLHTIDMSSTYFKSLPVDVRHEILTDLKETRKQNSWGRLHEMPKQSDDFSGYQMKRLLKRQAVQSALEEAEKEMGGHSLSLAELESILKDHGVATINDVGKRIASDENTRYLYIKDVKQALDQARKEQQRLQVLEEDDANVEKAGTEEETVVLKSKTIADQEFEDDLQKAIALSLEDPSTSKKIGDKQKLEFSFLENFNDADFQSDSSEEFEDISSKKTFSSAQNYMIEYSGLTPSEIAKIMEDKSKKPLKKSKGKKRTEQKIELKTIEVLDSDDSNEFVEVPVEENKADGVKNSEHTEAIKSMIILDDDKVQIISDSGESNDVTVNEVIGHKEGLKEDVEVTTKAKKVTDNVTEQVQGISQSNEVLAKENKVNEAGDAEIDTKKGTNDNESIKNMPIYQNKCVKIDEILIKSNNDSDIDKIEKSKLVTDEVKDDSNGKNEKDIDSIEIMSDSGESDSSVEFLEVSESKEIKNSMEIVIDVNKGIDGKNNLFGDVFNKDEDDKGYKRLEILIDPQSKLEDDLFSDVFEDTAVITDKSETDSHKADVTKKEDISIVDVKVSVTDKKAVDPKNETSVDVNVEQLKKIEEKDIENTNSVGKLKEIQVEEIQVDSKKEENAEIEKKVEEIQKLKLSVEEMQDLKHNLQREKINLMVERSTRERMATNITDQMYQEAQELLELFGVPYIVAPMEAEAQCAFLDAIELTDGTITDDSDIWLFGGRTVYKNFFNQSKYVMEFKDENIKHHFKLTREQMILLALLVGSDYTTGIQGIGPVTALEILAAFPPSQAKEFTLSHAELISGLKEFHSWLTKGRNAGPGRSALKSKLKNVSITDNFPSLQVVQAYMEPTVDTSREKFSWGKPDFEGLTDFARRRFGWSPKKAEEILKPVIKRMQEKRVQTSIKDFFKATHKIISSQEAKEKMSKRVKSAIDRIGKTKEELIVEEMEALSKAQQKKIRGKRQTENGSKKASRKKKSSVETNNGNETSKEVEAETKTKQRRTRKKRIEDSSKASTNKIADDRPSVSDSKKPRKKVSLPEGKPSSEDGEVAGGASLEQDQDVNEEDELQKYENIAKELKKRRQKRNELTKNMDTVDRKKQIRPVKKPNSVLPEDVEGEAKKVSIPHTTVDQNQRPRINEEINELERDDTIGKDLGEQRSKSTEQHKFDATTVKKQSTPIVDKNFMETIPEGLEGDNEIKFFQATTSRSLKRVEEIDREVKRELDQETKKKCLPNFHKREVIHQKLRDKSDLLRNKMKAIEVFRKSKKGPGYVEKHKRKVKLPKEDAGLSENSSDE